ncbi:MULTISPECIES: MFS transporter [unclassified Streptomyces]|uniref:MFS transporter n=1 Tax=unclassified Streptomyces TaxID=2593676 RepID=UPI0022373E8E|nr:MFS transporter [Streptomyces sp. SHP 1-2]MCW5252761.1 MFS transporter [Streptomyces sp. SHP 1-2]
MTTTHDPHETQTGAPPTVQRTGPVLLVLLSAMFFAQFDFFVVNVAAPSMEESIHATSGQLELVVGGYAFAYAAGMITGGRLGDGFGHRRLFIIGTLAFGVTSLLCGLADTPAQLIVARLAQGLAGAVMVPPVLAVITAYFPDEKKGRAMAWYGVAAGLGSIAGQVLGGALVASDFAGLGWRTIFLINVPFCLLIALAALKVLPARTRLGRTGLDPVGALGVSAALALLLVPLTTGHASGWPAWTWISMALALPFGAATLWYERSLAARGGNPVLVMSLFRSESFRSGVIAGVAFMIYFGSFMFTLTLLLQSGLGLDPLEAGLVFSPMGVLFTATSMVGGRLTARWGMNALVVSGGVTALGLALLALRLAAAGADTGLPWIVFCLCLIGGGNGVVLPALFGAALTTVRPQDAGTASGILTTTQQFASAAGVAAVGALFFATAGKAPTDGDWAGAMAWATWVCFLLVLVVMVTTWTFKRFSPPPVRS